jgi:hypothetical protein
MRSDNQTFTFAGQVGYGYSAIAESSIKISGCAFSVEGAVFLPANDDAQAEERSN